MDRTETRRQKLRKSFRAAGVDSILVTNPTNVTYLTGFTGEDSFLFVHSGGAVLLSDFRFITQLKDECPGLDVEIRGAGKTLIDGVANLAKKTKTGKLGIEGDSMTVVEAGKVAQKLPKCKLVTTSGLIEKQREIKDAGEIKAIRKAVWCASRAFGMIRSSLLPKQTEKEVADQLEYHMRCLGAEDRGFPSIVAVGPQAALPHANPGSKTIDESDLLLIDWGARCGLYRSDLTRVLVTGKISPKLERVYRVVLQAQLKGIEAIRPGVTGHEVDTAARNVIEKAGFGKQFGHSLGHGVGLDIHEGPRLARNSKDVLRPGMIVTVEPGIYLPGWGGVRIEDDILVTKKGHEVLSSVPKSFEDAAIGYQL